MGVMTREQISAWLNQTSKISDSYAKADEMCNTKKIKAILENDFENISHKDWYTFFVYKAAEHGVEYVSDKNTKTKEYSILKSLITNYEPQLIKAMIEWVWDGKHNLMPKESINFYILTKGFLKVVVPMAVKYMQGLIDKNGREYDPRLHISRNKNLEGGGVWIAGRKIT